MLSIPLIVAVIKPQRVIFKVGGDYRGTFSGTIIILTEPIQQISICQQVTDGERELCMFQIPENYTHTESVIECEIALKFFSKDKD